MKPEETWLLALADSEGPCNPLPSARLEAKGVADLCELAHAHGVLPAVLREVERLLKEQPALLLARPTAANELHSTLNLSRECSAKRAAMAMFLGAEARRLADELAVNGAQVIVLKGTDFATRLYSKPGLRFFGDVDLLVRGEDWDRVDRTLTRLGYEALLPLSVKYSRGDAEVQYQHPAMPGATVEIHDDLVNSSSVRRGVSVRLEDLPLERDARGGWQASPAGLLVMAAVHGAASHSFDKLQQLCDIAQAARERAGAIDEKSLVECMDKTSAGFCLSVGLDLAARALGDQASARWLERLNPRGPRRLARWLVSPETVVKARGPWGCRKSWRRQTLRRLLKIRR
jgi:hypothetical protein